MDWTFMWVIIPLFVLVTIFTWYGYRSSIVLFVLFVLILILMGTEAHQKTKVDQVIIPQGLYHVLYEEKLESNAQPQIRRLFVKGEKEEQFYDIKLDTKDLPFGTRSFVKTSDKFYPADSCKKGKRKLW